MHRTDVELSLLFRSASGTSGISFHSDMGTVLGLRPAGVLSERIHAGRPHGALLYTVNRHRDTLVTFARSTMFPGHILGVIPVTEKSYEQDVLPAFEDGLNSLASVAETLLTSTNLPQGFENVRQLLESSHKSLSKAEESSLAQVKTLSANAEERLDKINRLNDDQKALEARANSLKAQLSGQQGQESLAREQLQAAKNALKNADNALDRANQALHAAEEEKKVGIGLIYVPIVGPIAGGIMICKASEAIQNALNEAEEAKKMRKIYTDSVNKYESELQSYREAIRSTEQTIAANTVEIQALQRDLNSERELYQKLNQFLIPLRKCTSFLSTLSGKTSAANMYLEISGVLDGLQGIVDEIVVVVRPLVGNSRDYSLLISAKLPTIINKLEEANRRLKKAAAP